MKLESLVYYGRFSCEGLDAAGRYPANVPHHERAVKVFLSNNFKHQSFALWIQPVVNSQKRGRDWVE